MKPVIYLAFSNDKDRYLRNLPEEQKRIAASLERAVDASLCELVMTTNTTVHDMLAVFQKYRGEVAIFHYGGHAGAFQLLMEAVDGSTQAANARGLAEFLGLQENLQLVFLNGCSTLPQVAGLLAAGIPAVIATSEEIPDKQATDLSTLFYTAIAGGASIGTAFAEAVAGIRITDGDAEHRGERTRRKMLHAIDQQLWGIYTREGAERVTEWNLPKATGNPLYGLPDLPRHELPVKPYRHLKWFTPAEAELFFGRGREIRDIYTRIITEDAAPIILFFGASGVGKSSLLAAGLGPRLEPSHEVMYLRRHPESGLSGTLETALIEHSKPERLDAPLELDGKPLPAYLEELQASLNTHNTDQASRQLASLEQLVSALRHSLRTDSPASSLVDAWHLREAQTGKPLVVLLDQVEEAFTRQAPRKAENELKSLINEITRLFKTGGARPRGRLILSFRKEWSPDIIALFEEAGLFFARVFLERLDQKGTIEAIRGVADTPRLQAHYGLTIEEGLDHEIASYLLADLDSPLAPTLQILLTKMWDAATRANGDGSPVFTRQRYHALKNQGILLKDFLNEQLNALHAWNPGAVDSGLALDLLVLHTTPHGTARRRTKKALDSYYAHHQDVLNDLIKQCENKYLLVTRTRGDEPGAPQTSTRLAHDTLAPFVRSKFEESDAPGQRAIRILQNKKDTWEDHREGDPLDGPDLKTVESGQYGMRSWTKAEQRLVEASRKKRKTRKIISRSVAAFVVLSIITIAGVSFLADQRRIVAEQNENRTRAQTYASFSQGASTPEERSLFAVQSFLSDPTQPLAMQALYDVRETFPGLVDILRGHTAEVLDVAFNPDGTLLATASSDHSIRLWDTETGEQRAMLTEHTDDVNGVAFSPDGTLLASASHDDTIRLWNPDSSEVIDTLEAFGDFTDVAFSPDGAVLAASSEYSRIRLWRTSTREPLDTLRGHTEYISNIAYSPDGNILASAARDSTVRLWNPSTGDLIGTLKGHNKNINSVAFSPDGKILASGVSSSPVRLWDPATGDAVDSLKGNSRGVAFSPDGNILATTPSNGTISLWNPANGDLITTLTGHSQSVMSVAFSPDGSQLASASQDHTAWLWNPAEQIEQATMAGHTKEVNSVAYSPDGALLASASDDHTVRLWNPATGKLIRTLKGHRDYVHKIIFSPDGNLLASASFDKTIRLWNPDTGEVTDTLLGHNGSVRDIAFNPAGNLLASASADNSVRLWNLHNREKNDTLRGHSNEVNSVAFNPKGSILVSGSSDNTVRFWDPKTGTQKRDSILFSGEVMYVAFSPDGNTLVVNANGFHLLNFETGDEVLTLRDASNGASNLVFSPDGKTLASADGSTSVEGVSNTIRLWSTETGDEIATLRGHKNWVTQVDFSPDGSHLASSSKDGTLKIWQSTAYVENLIPHACRIANRNLSRQEWLRYSGNRPYECTCPEYPPGAGVPAPAKEWYRPWANEQNYKNCKIRPEQWDLPDSTRID